MRNALAPAVFLIGLAMPIVPAVAADFSEVTTNAAAKKLAAAGELVQVRIFPDEFGGPKDKMNLTYITPAAAMVREAIIYELSRRIDADEVNRMEVDLDYKGKSVIPTRLYMKAWHTDKPGTVDRYIEVW